jgi:hypothetical protein
MMASPVAGDRIEQLLGYEVDAQGYRIQTEKGKSDD